jgi:hypothetical protein
MDRDLSAVDHEATTQDGAMAIIDGYFARLRPKYDSGDEAIAETMFGFQRSKGEFVEICINGPDSVSFKYETSEARKILFLSMPRVYQKELTLHSSEEVKAKVRAFFALDSTSFKAEVER